MLGPGVAWYLAVGSVVFAIGTAGVMLRRNPLIMLLALELMLNGGNLVLIAPTERQRIVAVPWSSALMRPATQPATRPN